MLPLFPSSFHLLCYLSSFVCSPLFVGVKEAEEAEAEAIQTTGVSEAKEAIEVEVKEVEEAIVMKIEAKGVTEVQGVMEVERVTEVERAMEVEREAR